MRSNEGKKTMERNYLAMSTNKGTDVLEDLIPNNGKTIERMNTILNQIKMNPVKTHHELTVETGKMKEVHMNIYGVVEQQNKILRQSETNPVKKHHEMLDVNDEKKEELIGRKERIDRNKKDLNDSHYITDLQRGKISYVTKEVQIGSKECINRKKKDLYVTHNRVVEQQNKILRQSETNPTDRLEGAHRPHKEGPAAEQDLVRDQGAVEMINA